MPQRRPARSVTRASKAVTPASARKMKTGSLLQASAKTIRFGTPRLGGASMGSRPARATSSGAQLKRNACVPHAMPHSPGAGQSVAVSAEPVPTGTTILRNAKKSTAVSAGSLTPMQAPALSMPTISIHAPTKCAGQWIANVVCASRDGTIAGKPPAAEESTAATKGSGRTAGTSA